ncbi:unnamed protein product [Ilex paraguariensis]|uniref:Uncharacterized protein n=1 Tax=Ilex paraguariensis TaxID=185542 RepID=A0ABC8RQE8_9AQUA
MSKLSQFWENTNIEAMSPKIRNTWVSSFALPWGKAPDSLPLKFHLPKSLPRTLRLSTLALAASPKLGVPPNMSSVPEALLNVSPMPSSSSVAAWPETVFLLLLPLRELALGPMKPSPPVVLIPISNQLMTPGTLGMSPKLMQKGLPDQHHWYRCSQRRGHLLVHTTPQAFSLLRWRHPSCLAASIAMRPIPLALLLPPLLPSLLVDPPFGFSLLSIGEFSPETLSMNPSPQIPPNVQWRLQILKEKSYKGRGVKWAL